MQTAKWWQDRFHAGLSLVGKEDGEWLWMGDDKAWKYLGWLEDGLSYDELEASKN